MNAYCNNKDSIDFHFVFLLLKITTRHHKDNKSVETTLAFPNFLILPCEGDVAIYF